jgi:GNAT superfamily N-acetyltransferase
MGKSVIPFRLAKFGRMEDDVACVATFIQANEYLLPDPYSLHTDLREYARKLCSLGECWGLWDGTRMVGFCGGYINGGGVGRRAYLQLLLVTQSHWGSGAGKLLVSAFRDYALAQKFADIQLTVDEENQRARTFYAKMGFENSPENHPRNGKLYLLLTLSKLMGQHEPQARDGNCGEEEFMEDDWTNSQAREQCP